RYSLKENQNKSSTMEAKSRSPLPIKSKRGVHGDRVPFRPPPDATAASPTGADPHPGFSYHGGAVVLNPQVFAIYLGDWASAANQARAARLNQYLTDLVASTYMNILSQYGCGTGGNFIASAFVANNNHNLHEADIHRALQAAINSNAIPEPNNHNNVYIV